MKKILFALLLLPVFASAQRLQYVNTYGYQYQRVVVDSLFAPPSDTFTVPTALQGYPFIARKGTGLYLWNTSTHVWAAVSGGGGTPTWQQTLTSGSTLTGNNTIAGGGFFLTWNNMGRFYINDGTTTRFKLNSSNIDFLSPDETQTYSITNSGNTFGGNIFATGLTNLSTQNRLIGQFGTGGQFGYVTLGAGLSLSSGVLNTSGTVATPISSLTAATGTNSIDNTTFGQSWSWTNLVSTGLSLTSASTAAPAGTTHKILSITASGANATASASTFGVFSANTHTGTNSTNYGVYGSSSNGTLNVGTVGISSGGTTSIGGQFSSSGGTTNYGVTGNVTGAATTNYGAEFSASGGTTNNALNIAAGALTLNGSAGTSGQVLTSAGANTLPTWTTPSTVATAVPLSGITAATGTNSINNGNNTQTWNWPTLTNGTGLLLTSLASTTGTTGGSVLTVLRSGALANASQTTYGAIIQNQHTGTTETNVGLKVEATGATNNYALIVPSGSGNVGIGTSSPTAQVHTTGTVKLTGLAASANATDSMMVVNVSDGSVGYREIPVGGLTMGTTPISGGGTNRILFEDASNKANSNSNFTYDEGNVRFKVGFNGTGTAMYIGDPNGDEQTIGDYDVVTTGSKFTIFPNSSLAYFDNTAHDGKFGINTNSPSGALHVKANGGAIDALFVDNTTGNVGIGTATPNSTLHNNGSFAGNYIATATGITLDATNYVVAVTATGQTVTLPDAVGIDGRIYTIKLTASGSCTVSTTGGETIDGGGTYSLASQYKYVTIMSNGANWIVIGNN